MVGGKNMIDHILNNESKRRGFLDVFLTKGIKVVEESLLESLQEKDKTYDIGRLRIDVRALKDGFTSEDVWGFILENEVVKGESADALFLQREGEITLQKWGEQEMVSRVEKETSGAKEFEEEKVQLIGEQLKQKYVGWKNFSRKNQIQHLKYISKQVRRYFRAGKTEEAAERVVGIDEEEVDKVLRNFKVDGKRLKRKMFADNEVPSLRGMMIVGSPNENKLKQYKRTLESEPDDHVRSRLRDVIRYLDSILNQDYPYVEADKLDADRLIGKLDLKFLSRRREIYEYWENIHTEKFKDLITAVKDFNESLEDFETDNEDLQSLIDGVKKYAEEFDQYPHNMQYTIELSSVTMQDYEDKRDKFLILFERFMSIGGLIGTGEYARAETMRQLQEELGEGMSPSEMGFGSTGGKKYDEFETEVVDTTEAATDVKFSGRVGSMAGPQEVTRDYREMDDPMTGQHHLSDEAREDARERSRLGRKLKQLWEDVKVDPLFFYVYAPQQNKENEYKAWLDTPLFEKEVRSLRLQFRVLGAKYTTDIDAQLQSHIDKLLQQASDTKEIYHLPVTEKLLDFITNRNLRKDMPEDTKKLLDDPNSVLENITDFLEVIGHIIDSGEEVDRLSSPIKTSVPKGEKKKDAPSMQTVHFGSSRAKSHLDDIAEVREDFDKLLKAIHEYYVLPMSSRYKPLDDDISFGAGESGRPIKLFKILTQDVRDANPFFMLLWAESRYHQALVSKTQLSKMVKAIGELSEPSTFKDMGDLRASLRDLKNVANEIMGAGGKSYSEDLDIEIGAWLHGVLQKNNKKEMKWNRKPTATWAEKYNSDTIYPIEAIESYLSRSTGAYTDVGMGGLLTKLRVAIDNMNIIKSETEIPLLEIHDTIRKMMDKPIYYNTSKLNNYNHVNTAINILEKEYNVQITASEIERVVNEVDSMENLSKRHGIPSESVYFLKATFR